MQAAIEKEALQLLLRSIGSQRNLCAYDFSDVEVRKLEDGRIAVGFAMKADAVGKLDRDAHEGLRLLLD